MKKYTYKQVEKIMYAREPYRNITEEPTHVNVLVYEFKPDFITQTVEIIEELQAEIIKLQIQIEELKNGGI